MESGFAKFNGRPKKRKRSARYGNSSALIRLYDLPDLPARATRPEKVTLNVNT